MSYLERLQVTLETLKDEARIAQDISGGATGDMPEADLQLHRLRAAIFRATAEALQPILEERREEETDGSATE